jgi:hypothetical protein
LTPARSEVLGRRRDLAVRRGRASPQANDTRRSLRYVRNRLFNVEKGLRMFYVVLVIIAAVLLAGLFFVRGRGGSRA